MSSVIKLEHVEKTYPMGEVDVHALVDIDLTIERGEFVAIVGHSGSGKSTLMHIIGLLDKPTKGRVTLEGKKIENLTEDELAFLRNKHIGFVFQSFNLLPRTSAIDNVSLPLIYTKVKGQRILKAKKALEEVGLGERQEHFPSQLSGGQQQRVAIARALINNPSIVLADEPTGNLATNSGEEIMHLLEKLNGRGNTIVLVTHELDIAKSAQRIVELKDGKVIKDTKN